MKLSHLQQTITALAIFTMLGLGGPVMDAQAADADQGQIVIEDLSKPELRAEIDKIQNEFYRVFNSLNDDDDFDIECQKFTRTGSNIPELGCEPKFVTRRRGQNASDFRAGTDDLLTVDALQDELQPEFAKLTEKMNAIAAENEYFRELNQILQMLRGRMAELEK